MNNAFLLKGAIQHADPEAGEQLRNKMQAGWYLVLALAHLLLLFLAKPFYNCHRHRLTMLQRGLRLLNIIGVYTIPSQDLYMMLGAKHDKPSIPGPVGVLKYQMFILNLLFQGAINFTLPMKYLIWFQLSVAVLKLGLLRKLACGAALSTAFINGAVQNCLVVQIAAYGVVGILPAYHATRGLSLADPRICEGPSALWLTQAYLDCIILLGLILGCTYLLEFWAKKQYVESLGMQLHYVVRRFPWEMSAGLTPTLVAVALSALWVLLEAMYLIASPLLAC
jgi:hypothetical protein